MRHDFAPPFTCSRLSILIAGLLEVFGEDVEVLLAADGGVEVFLRRFSAMGSMTLEKLRVVDILHQCCPKAVEVSWCDA